MITDPATELHDLCLFLRGAGENAKPTSEALAGIFKCENNSDPLFFAILAALAARFDRLRLIVETPEKVPEHLRPDALKAIRHLRGFIASPALNSRWDQLKKQVFVPEHLTALRFLGPLIQREAPLKKLSKEEREALIQEIDETLANIEKGKCNAFVKDAIATALESIKTVLERFEFFGIDAVTEKLVLAHTSLSMGMAEADSRNDRTDMSAIKKAFTVVCAVAGVLIFSDDVLDAIEDHHDRAQAIIRYIAEVEPKEIKALPAPEPSQVEGPEQTDSKTLAITQKEAAEEVKPVPALD